jgi:hypothetical protein
MRLRIRRSFYYQIIQQPVKRPVESSHVNTGGNISVIKVRPRDDIGRGKIPVCVTEEALVVPNQSHCLIWTPNSHLFDRSGETLVANCGGDVAAAEDESFDGLGSRSTSIAVKRVPGVPKAMMAGMESGICAVSSCVSWCCFCWHEQVQHHE